MVHVFTDSVAAAPCPNNRAHADAARINSQKGVDAPEKSGSALTSLQLGVLGLGLFQDGDVSVGIFPQGEEILIGLTRSRRVA
jgi:hypothetical protein